ncbi:hypothetical protein D3C84_675460 [compost metagenome]
MARIHEAGLFKLSGQRKAGLKDRVHIGIAGSRFLDDLDRQRLQGFDPLRQAGGQCGF